jgi:hypothetical protein
MVMVACVVSVAGEMEKDNHPVIVPGNQRIDGETEKVAAVG